MRYAGGLAAAAALLLLTAGTALAQYSDNKIKIGILDDFSGQYCTGNCMGPVNAVQIAVDEFGGKIGNTPIEVIHGDHQNKPDVGVALANKWYDTEQVDVIVDVVNSAVALAVQGIARTKGKAVLYSSAGSADLTGPQCAPYSAQWTYDTYQFGKSIGEAIPSLGKKWFILAADYVYGKGLAASVEAQVKAAGGTVVGTVFHPFGTSDFSSFMLQAQASKADVIALANAGQDMDNAIKSAHEFGLIEQGIKVVPLSLDAALLGPAGGLDAVQGMMVTLPWYAGLKPEAQKFSDEYNKRQGSPGTYLMTGLYSAVHNYLLAAQATGTDDPKAIFAKMQATPINDAFATNGHLRPDGRMVHDVYLVQFKKPSESTGPNDVARLIATIPGDKAFRPMSEGGCPYIKTN